MDLASAIDLLARWAHFIGLLVWMGHNYANFIQSPRYQRPKPEVVQEMFLAASRREHGIFRHASLVVLLSGLYMLWHRGILVDALTLSGSWAVLGLGAWLGTAMTLNLWFVMWPHQKKVLGFVPASNEERVRCSRVTFLSSRTNTILSFATLFLMVAGAHGLFLFH